MIYLHRPPLSETVAAGGARCQNAQTIDMAGLMGLL